MSKKSNFTVLMPLYDGTSLQKIKDSIKSILSNTLLPKEFLIIVDGAISTKKRNYLLNLKNNSIKLFFIKKIGIEGALNFGINKAKFNVIARADSDDIYPKDRFEIQYKIFQSQKCDVLGGNVLERSSEGNFKKKIILNPGILLSLFKNPMNHMTVMYKKKIIQSVGGYKNIKYKEDMYLWIDLLSKKKVLKNIDNILAISDSDSNKIERRRNITSYKSEVTLFKNILNNHPKFFMVSFISLILRLIYLSIPNQWFLFLQNNIFRKK